MTCAGARQGDLGEPITRAMNGGRHHTAPGGRSQRGRLSTKTELANTDLRDQVRPSSTPDAQLSELPLPHRQGRPFGSNGSIATTFSGRRSTLSLSQLRSSVLSHYSRLTFLPSSDGSRWLSPGSALALECLVGLSWKRSTSASERSARPTTRHPGAMVPRRSHRSHGCREARW